MSINQFRTVLYAIAKASGDIQAAIKGSNAIGKRIARRWAGSLTARALSRLFR